jgi:Zn-dependent protease
LAGPLWGLGAALVAFALYLGTGSQLWATVARVGAWLNLFNLIPVWQLDGSRGIKALDRTQVWMLAMLATAMWVMVNDGMLILLALVLAFQATRKPRDGIVPDGSIMIEFSGLIVALSLLCLIPLPAVR